MTDKVQKIREEVVRLQNELIQEKEKGYGSDVDDTCILELQNVLTYIDSLQEESVKEGQFMKVNELMIEVLVYFNCFDGSKIIVRVTGFKDRIVYGDSEKGSHWCNIGKVEPIPLTPEILEKNGFSEDYRYEDLSYAQSCGDVIGIHINGKNGLMDEMYFKYVHELQHAMRLCGVEKEIVLQ